MVSGINATAVHCSLPQYKEYEEVVVEHRAMKEKQRLKEEQEAREGRAATKVGPRQLS